MAIQIRRGSDADWEAGKQNIVAGEPAVTLDTKRAFIGIGTGQHLELETKEQAQTIEGKVGDLTELETEVKTDLVSAINEVEGEAEDLGSAITDLNNELDHLGLEVVDGFLNFVWEE